MSRAYIPGIDNSYGPTTTSHIQVPIKHSVFLTIAPVEGGYLMDINQGSRHLCVGAESVEQGVRHILTHLVAKGLEA